MTRLRVKYCYYEDELNDFLKTLEVDSPTTYPKLHLIHYLPHMRGDGYETAVADDSGITARATVDNDIIAVVQYFVKEED